MASGWTDSGWSTRGQEEFPSSASLGEHSLDNVAFELPPQPLDHPSARTYDDDPPPSPVRQHPPLYQV
eukprot:3547881-Pyramimonas_sp.AAC.1